MSQGSVEELRRELDRLMSEQVEALQRQTFGFDPKNCRNLKQGSSASGSCRRII